MIHEIFNFLNEYSFIYKEFLSDDFIEIVELAETNSIELVPAYALGMDWESDIIYNLNLFNSKLKRIQSLYQNYIYTIINIWP